MKSLYVTGFLFLSAMLAQAQTLELSKDINPGAANSTISYWDVTFLGDEMIFAATSAETGREVYILKDDSVRLLKDLKTGPGGSGPEGFFQFKDEVYFFASVSNSRQIWKTDGTEEGTAVAISFTGSTFEFSPIAMVSRDDKFYFTRNGSLYVSDGTQAGTIECTASTDISFLVGFAFPNLNVDRFEDGIAFVVEGDTSFQLFSAVDTNVVMLGTINVSPQNSFSVIGPFEVDGGLVLIVRDGPSTVGDLYLYNKATGLLAKYNTTKIVAEAVDRINDQRILIMTINSCYTTNGTNAGTVKILNTSAPPSSGFNFPLVRIGDAAIFHGGEPTLADAVHATNGTVVGTRLVKTIPGNSITDFVARGPYAFWMNDVAYNGEPTAWYADINGVGATMLYKHPTPLDQFDYEINPLGVTKDKVYFVATLDETIGGELYSLDHFLNLTGIEDILQGFDFQIIQDRLLASFKIKLDTDNSAPFQVSIHDMLGKHLNTVTAVEDQCIQLPDVPGAYTITIQTKEGIVSRVIIQ